MALVTLVEAQPWDPVTGAVVPVRLAGGGRRHYRHKGFADWRAGVVDRPRITELLDFDGNFTGGAIPMVNAIGFMPARPSTRFQIARLMWVGAPITVSIGDDEAAAPIWTIEMAGTVAGYSIQGGSFTFTIANLAGRLDKPLVTATFAGTGGIEGNAAAAGRLKRRSWGRCWNVEGRLLDPAYNIYEFGDPTHALDGFDQVKDKGRLGPLAIVAWAGSIDATLAALKAAPAPVGGAAVAPSIACAKWYTQPVAITADLRGEVTGGYVETVAGIAAAISAAAGGPPMIDLAAAIAARPDPAGLHVDDAGERGVAALDRVLVRASMGWSIVASGGLAIAPLAFADPIATIVGGVAEREAAFAPVTAVKIGWRRNHRIFAAGDISAAVLANEVSFDDGSTVEEWKPATPGATAGAPVGTTVGGTVQPDGTIEGGMAAGEVIGLLEAIEPLTEAAELLKRADIDQQALGRQRDRDAVKLEQALMRALLEDNRTREVLRDAGIVVDPATGRVRIYGVDQATDRLTRVEIDLDATRGRLSLLATSDYVNEAIARAQLDPTGQAALDEIIASLSSARIDLDGLKAAIVLKAENTTVTTLGGRVVAVAQELDALTGEVALKASTTDFAGLDTRVKAAELRLTTIGDMSALAIAVRQARYAEEATAAGSLQAILSADDTHRRQLVAAAEARQEMVARIDDGRAADAVARLALAVRLADSDARLAREESARATGDRAQAEALTAAEARIGEAARAQANTLTRAIVDGDEASAQAIGEVSATVGRVSGRVDTLSDVVVGPAGAQTRAVVRLTTDGLVSGFVQTNDGTEASFAVAANRFGVYHPVTGALLFYVDEDGAIAASFKPSAIGAGNLKPGSAQGSAYFTTTADMVIPRGYTGQLIQMAFDKVDAGSDMEILFYGHFIAEDDIQFDCRFIIDGATRHVESADLILVDSNAKLTITPFRFFRDLSAGQHTISIEIYNREADNRRITVAAGATLKCTELRQASVGSAVGSMGQVIAGTGTGGGSGDGGGGGGGGGITPIQQN